MRILSISRSVVILMVVLFLPHFSFSQTPGVRDTVHISSQDLPHFCGITPQYVTQSNMIAHGEGPGDDEVILGGNIYTDPCAIDPNAIRINMGGAGRIRVFFEDLNSNTGDGFDDGALGPDRINTMMAVCDYVENVIDLSNLPAGEFMDIYMERSFAFPNNPATNQGYLAIGGPYYSPGTWGVTQGFYDGHVFTHVVQGFDPEACQYDGHVLVNFHGFLDPYNNFVPITYWNDFQNTTQTCSIDLFTVLLHELTHTMGWLSAVIEDPNTFTAQCGNPANSYSRYDNLFNFYYDQPTGTFTQVVDASGPTINAGMAAFTNPLRSNTIWLNQQGAPDNQPVYAGVLDPNYPFLPNSAMSHLNAATLSFTAMSQFSPGYQPDYVMGPAVGRAQRKREYTIPEIRTLIALGYGLGPIGGVATLNPFDNTDMNSGIILNNTPAFRSDSWGPTGVPMLAYNTPFNFMELMQPDQVMTNANIPNTAPTSSWSTTINALANVSDNQGNTLRIMPGSLFGIRGVSDAGNQAGGNDHNCVVETGVTPNGSTGFTYTPIPGFHGRAQFGFYLWDGHERGALRIVTIDVTPNSNYTVTQGDQMVVYPDLEDGTELRQRVQNPNFENSQIVDWQYESVFAGQNFSGGHYFNYVTNWWNLAGGDVTDNTWYGCFMGPTIPENGDYGSPTSDQNQTFGGYLYPTQVVTPGTNERYHHFQGPWNYSTLINEVSNCNIYRFECDLNFENSGFTVGQTFQFQLQFVDNPFPALHTQLYYTAPVQVTITTVAPNSWQHVTFDFQYCGTSTHFMNLLVQGIVAPTVVITGTGNSNGPGNGGPPLTNTFTPYWGGPNSPFIDNISLIEINPTPPPLTVTVVANPASVCNGATSTLTASSAPYLPCNAAYTWQPAVNSLNQQNSIVQTNAVTVPTTYTATLTYACSQVVTGTVTVTPSPLPVITPMGPYCNNDNIGHLLVATPAGGIWSGPGVSTTFSGSYFNAFSAGTGTHTITYTYIPYAGCTTVVTTNIVVNPAPVITFGANGPYCSTQPPQALNASPAGGTWTGPSVTFTSGVYYFSPSIGAGNYVLTYSATSGSCTSTTTTTVTVVAPPVINITPVGPLCTTDPATALSATPAGGVFTGTGVTFSAGTYYFNPSSTGSGTFTVTYTVSGVCPAASSIQIVVIPGNTGTWPKFLLSTTGMNVRSEGFGIVSDGNGNTYVTGRVITTGLSQGYFTGPSTSFSTNFEDIFVAKFSDRCGLQWYKIFGGSAYDQGNDIALDANGNVYVCGITGGSYTFATGFPVSLPTSTGAFVARMNASNGTVTGLRYSAATSGNISGQSLAVNQSTGDVYMSGFFNQNITFAPLSALAPSAAGNTDVFVVRFNNALTAASWNTIIYSTGTDAAGGLGIDNSGNLYIGTTVIGAGVANSTTYSAAGTTGAHPFIVKYNSSNTFVAAKIMGSNGNNAYLRDLVCDGSGKVYFCGNYNGPITFLNPYTTVGTDVQMYVSRIEPSLTFNSACWTITAGNTTSSTEDATGLCVDATNGIYFTGYGVNNCTFTGFTPSSITSATGSREAFVARITPTGIASTMVHTVASSLVGTGNTGSAICTNSSGTQYSTGKMQASTTFGSLGTFPSTGYNFFAARELNASSFYRYDDDVENTAVQPLLNSTDQYLLNEPEEITAFPNPTNGLVTLVFNNVIPANSELLVTDIYGRAVEAQSYPSSSKNTIVIDLSTCENGVYLIVVKNTEKQYVKRIVLQR